MLAAFPELLETAAARGRALGAFTCYNLETAVGVLGAAEERQVGVVLLVSPKSFAARGGEALVAALRAVAERSTAPSCVQLDHVSEPAMIRTALGAGVGAVLADGSRLPLQGNIDFVREAVALARSQGGHVEAELGGIAGDEDVTAAVAAGALTEPVEAARLVAESGAACLAVSIGNVHGEYREPPSLDWERLAAIRETTDAPLSLHGASGLPDADIERAIASGIAKVNVNTELRRRYLDTTAEHLARVRDGARLLELNAAQAAGIAAFAGERLDAYRGGSR